jgi:hypothetical protein
MQKRPRLVGNPKKPEKHYQSPVTMSTYGGFVHDAALAQERYGEFLLQHGMSDKREATYHLVYAFQYCATIVHWLVKKSRVRINLFFVPFGFSRSSVFRGGESSQAIATKNSLSQV